MIFKREATQSFSTGSAAHLLLAPVQGSEWAPRAKGAAEADTKERELVDL